MSPETPVANDAIAADASSPIAVEAQDRSAFGDNLRCPRCDYNLRGSESERCAECGLVIDWPDIIYAALQCDEVPTFEFQWRHSFVRSFFATLLLSIQPWKLWKRIPLATQPRPGELLLLLVLTLPAYFLFELALHAFEDIAAWSRYPRSYWRLSTFRDFAAIKSFMNFKGISYCMLASLGIFTYCALSIFQRSLLGFRVRRIHLLRIAVLVFCCFLAAVMLNQLIRSVLLALTWSRPSRVALVYNLHAFLDAATLLLPAWCISRAARDYLRVPRPWQFGLTILAVGFLIVMTVYIVYSIVVDDLVNMLSYAGGDLWPGLGRAIDSLWARLAA